MRSMGARIRPRRASIQKFLASRVGLPPGLERRLALEAGGEQIRVQAQLVGPHAPGVGAQADLEGVEHALDQAVEPEFGKPRAVRLHADPMVVVEDKGLLAVPVDEVDALAAERDHEVMDELHVVAVAPGGRVVRGIVQAAVDEILGREPVAEFLRKAVERPRTHRHLVVAPVGIDVAQLRLVVAPEPCEVVEHRCEPHD